MRSARSIIEGNKENVGEIFNVEIHSPGQQVQVSFSHPLAFIIIKPLQKSSQETSMPNLTTLGLNHHL